MSGFDLFFVGVALCLVAWFTVDFLCNLRRDKASFAKRLWRYLRNVFDALWGIG